MRTSALRLFLAVGLALSLFVGTLATGSADEPDVPTWVFFPWVPHDTMLGDLGPFYGAVTIQNLEAEAINVYFKATDDGELSNLAEFDQIELAAFGSVSLSSETLGVPDGGSGVIVTADTAAAHEPARIAGVQKQAAPVPATLPAPPGGAVIESTTSGVHTTVAGYTGLSEWDLDDMVSLPIVQTNTGWNTLIRVTNFEQDSEDADVTVTLRAAGGGLPIITHLELSAGETGTVDLLAIGIAPGWIGSAIVSADASVGVVAERVKAETHMLIMNRGGGFEHIAEMQFAPLVFNDYNLWNTGISVVNLANDDNEVTITYYDGDGDVVDTEVLEMSPYEMDFVYTPASGGEDGFVGSATITGEHPFFGAVDEVKYLGGDGDSGHAMSYMFNRDLIELGESLALPLAQRGDIMDGMGDTTGIQLFNPSEDSATVWIWFVHQDGSKIALLPHAVTVGPGESRTVYAFAIANLPNNFYGSAVVRVVAGNGAVTAVSNNVNYAVQYDGSAAFNLVWVGDVELPLS